MEWKLIFKRKTIKKANFVLLKENCALLMPNVSQLKFMDFVMDFQNRIYVHTCARIYKFEGFSNTMQYSA